MPPQASGFDAQRVLAEFADLNRRRLFGSPPLDVAEVERWLDLRGRLEAHFGSRGPDDWAGIERRQFLRLPTRIRIEFGAPDALQLGTIRDVSQGGLFIATHRPLEKGSQVRLEIQAAPGNESVEIVGQVAWLRTHRSGAQAPGMGIEFVQLGPEQRRLISDLVQRSASGD